MDTQTVPVTGAVMAVCMLLCSSALAWGVTEVRDFSMVPDLLLLSCQLSIADLGLANSARNKLIWDQAIGTEPLCKLGQASGLLNRQHIWGLVLLTSCIVALHCSNK